MTALVLPDTDIQPIDWATINRALIDWIKETVPAVRERVRWENQNIAQPSKKKLEFPYITMLRTSVVDEGGVAETRTQTLDANGDVVTATNGLTPDESEQISVEPVLINLAVSAHVDAKAGANDPSCDAMALLSRAKRALDVGSVVEKLSVACLSVVDEGSIIDTSVVVNGEWQSKATLDVVFRTGSALSSKAISSEKLSFIDNITLVPTGFPVDPIVDC